MIRSSDEEDIIENSFMLVLRDRNYKGEIYHINEEIKHNKNMKKLYGYNKERNLNVVITKIMNISLEENPNFENRLLTTIKLIEENKLLVENLWVEKTNGNNYTLYISELTNSIYRNEFNLITLNNYINSTQNTYKENIEILISIVEKMIYFQSINYSHLNIHPNNIYINLKNNSIYFGPPQLVKNYSSDCSYLWYSSPEFNYIIDDIWENNTLSNFNDIWSLGCIICEMFFINFPLFQAYSADEKIFKIIEILGFPDYEDVNYMNKYQYDSLLKRNNNINKENNLEGYLLSAKEDPLSNLYNFKIELIKIIDGCLEFNIINRISLNEILNKLNFLNSNISTEFQTKITYTINNTVESENSNYISSTNSNNININNNNNCKLNTKIQNINYPVESEEDNYLDKSYKEKHKDTNNGYVYENDTSMNDNNNSNNTNRINYYYILNNNNNNRNRNQNYKSQKNLVSNTTDIDKKLKNIYKRYEHKKDYERYSKNEDSKNMSKNSKYKYDGESLKEVNELNEEDEYKQLQRSKQFYIYFIFLIFIEIEETVDFINKLKEEM